MGAEIMCSAQAPTCPRVDDKFCSKGCPGNKNETCAASGLSAQNTRPVRIALALMCETCPYARFIRSETLVHAFILGVLAVTIQ